ncbi:enterobactin/ferric enterobactin esterase [Lacunisphaera limnophila]|uniref:Enterobactin/ferric enterobactin esterase n=1 Tax=Lacunisphaera limnophila TaxID=1838286 RepID=A0A1D8AR17_9BACT|nr:alpha/beta hydrolase-fold protein [Lacunisphaera limnophila]AOS43337.1 enterobactin/ferric enterobactin esterase [Lacunisphaera limnophila]
MKYLLTCVLFSFLGSLALAQDAAPARKPGDYPLTADSLPQEGVPKGQLIGPLEWKSQIIRGTVRRYWIYVPAQYDAAKPAGLLVFHDGQRALNPKGPLRVDQVMENLIHKKEIPVMIGLFITPGNLSERYPDDLAMSNPNNRAQEYDVLTDAYARMLAEEFIPELKKTYNLSDDVEKRVIGGTSSGAICAWTTAWERPDQFRKVLSMIGSYTSIGFQPARGNQPMIPGGDLYPTLIRKTPPKNIRIFLQDGSNDLDNPHGSWFLANQQMLAALLFANTSADRRKLEGPRYDVRHEWGDGAHNDSHGGALLPEMLRWMFRDVEK